MPYFFASFGLPREHLGVVCTQEINAKAALEKITMKGLNPGGEALIFQTDYAEAHKLGLDKFIPSEKMHKMGYKKKSEQSIPEQRAFDKLGTRVCLDCNEALRFTSLR